MLDSERKKILITEMKKTCNGADWITRKELEKSLGYKNHKYASEILSGIPKFNSKYLIAEVAEKIVESLN